MPALVLEEDAEGSVSGIIIPGQSQTSVCELKRQCGRPLVEFSYTQLDASRRDVQRQTHVQRAVLAEAC